MKEIDFNNTSSFSLTHSDLFTCCPLDLDLHQVLYCTHCTLRCTALYGAVLYCTVLYCTVLYCTESESESEYEPVRAYLLHCTSSSLTQHCMTQLCRVMYCLSPSNQDISHHTSPLKFKKCNAHN